MKKIILSSVALIALVGIIALTSGFTKCPIVSLASPPSTVKVTTFHNCTCTSGCKCGNVFTLTSNSCPNYTWNFTNTTTGWTCNPVTTTNTCTAYLRGTTGDAYTLVINDGGGGSSVTYNFTAVTCP